MGRFLVAQQETVQGEGSLTSSTGQRDLGVNRQQRRYGVCRWRTVADIASDSGCVTDHGAGENFGHGNKRWCCFWHEWIAQDIVEGGTAAHDYPVAFVLDSTQLVERRQANKTSARPAMGTKIGQQISSASQGCGLAGREHFQCLVQRVRLQQLKRWQHRYSPVIFRVARLFSYTAQPPSTTTSWPVMFCASSLARNTTESATSCGVVTLFRAISATYSS